MQIAVLFTPTAVPKTTCKTQGKIKQQFVNKSGKINCTTWIATLRTITSTSVPDARYLNSTFTNEAYEKYEPNLLRNHNVEACKGSSTHSIPRTKTRDVWRSLAFCLH